MSASPTWSTAIAVRVLLAAAAYSCFGLPAVMACGPDAKVQFTEGSDDTFLIENNSTIGLSLQQLVIDLSSAAGGVIFDTDYGGAGWSAYQPFQPLPSTAVLRAASSGLDGYQQISLIFDRFAPGDRFTFEIDLDDQLQDSEHGQTIVSGNEIAGAAVMGIFIDMNGQTYRATGYFETDGQAILSQGACS
ncbi:hypothetical protein [Hwanghaeella sp.]|uniref:hypothetical protein n=1 Tax=Hwanghaeella sp. TaxID=2605943 RepID=UPI003CCC0000